MSVRALKWAADVVRDCRLTAAQRALIWALAFLHHDKMGSCFPSAETLAEMAGLSVRKTRDNLHALAEAGLIHINKRTVRGRQRSNQFDLFGTPRGDAKVTPKSRLRGDKKSTPQRPPRGGTPASPDSGSYTTSDSEGRDGGIFRVHEEGDFSSALDAANVVPLRAVGGAE